MINNVQGGRGSWEMASLLIVDDAKFMRETLAKIFTDASYQVIGEAENGKEALDLYKQLKPDLVTMDLTMPVMNGLDTIQAIMKLDQQAKIVVCSAMGQQKIVVEAIELGAKDFIVKPFDKDRVLDTMNNVLEKG